jgi:hypothetical protein
MNSTERKLALENGGNVPPANLLFSQLSDAHSFPVFGLACVLNV